MENSVITILVILLTDLFVYRTFAKALYGDAITNSKKFYCIYTSIAILVYVLAHSYIIENGDEVEMIVCTLFLLLICNTNWKKRILITISTIVSIALIQQFVFFFMDKNALYHEFLDFDEINVILAIVVLLIALLIHFIKSKRSSESSYADIPNYLYINVIIGLSAAIIPMLVIFIRDDIIPTALKFTIISVSYFGLLCGVVTCILFMKNRNEKNKYYQENLMKEKLLKLQENHYEDIVKNYESLRHFKHDIKGHLRVLFELEKNKDYEKLYEYTAQLQDTIDRHSNFQCDNVYISAIINSFNEEVKVNDIDFYIEYSINGFITMESMDICSLIHNLVSNAIEETKKVELDRRKISLKIISLDCNLLIEISNTLSDDFDMTFIEEGKTSKKTDRENHGIGVQNIKSIVSKYDGDIKYTEEKYVLKASVVLMNIIEIN